VKIRTVIGHAEACKTAAMEVESRFEHMCGLAQEMVVACTHKAGNTEQILDINMVRLEVLKQQEEGEKQVLEQRKETQQMMKDSFKNAEDDFRDALKEMPKGYVLQFA
jgi:hypothetical protein